MRRITGAEAKALRKAATAGPWDCASTGRVRAANRGDGSSFPYVVGWDMRPHDAVLCAAAPDLAFTVEALEAERDEARRDLAANLAALCEILRPGSDGDPDETLLEAAERVACTADAAAALQSEVVELRATLAAERGKVAAWLRSLADGAGWLYGVTGDGPVAARDSLMYAAAVIESGEHTDRARGAK